MDGCMWLEPLPHESSDDEFMAYYGTIVWESARWSWIKLSVRCLLTLFTLRVLWRRYYHHYFPLLHALEEIGIDAKFSRYAVIAGDPTYMILSDPRVAAVMVADLMSTPAYVCWSVLRVIQFNDLTAFSLGCLYSTRFVWQGYLVMRGVSYLTKRRRWEAKFAPIDPGMLGFVAFLYGGPLFTLIGNTSLIAIFHFTWGFFLPSALEMEAIEAISGMIAGALLMQLFPLCFSLALQKLATSRQRMHGSTAGTSHPTKNFPRCICSRRIFQTAHAIAPSTTVATSLNPQPPPNSTARNHQIDQLSHRSFNDVKNRFFFGLMRWHAPEPRHKIGGSLHALHQRHAEYRPMPLFSCRAADCFVLCYTTDNQLELQVRLSFIDCLDTRMDDPVLAIPTCTSKHRASYATCNCQPCSTFKPTTSTSICIHTPQSGSKWLV
ncbi:hypothetical protein Ae201684_015498 [Aphanomyces euteiches]|uniref:Uncharacterized protein n=1 Tax=Aphanomyces euteiches TaxID=100861 RepID=A0A6G0WGG3_9STRA|nr:hypothetical protein Ae201684_015498 [Aphanomyces euteiches]